MSGRSSESERAPTLAVVTAMREELAPIRGLLALRRVHDGGGLEVWRGRPADGELVAAVTGEGAWAAERGLRSVLERFSPSAVLALGVAGGLSPDLELSDVVVARRVLAGREPVAPPDPQWLDRALQLPDTRAGTVVTEERLVVDPPAKHQLWLEVGAEGPAVVDLESASWARAAAASGVPFLVARAVSDTADDALPLDFNRFRDWRGGIDRRRIRRHLLLRPDLVAPLLDLRKRVKECAEALATFLEKLIGA